MNNNPLTSIPCILCGKWLENFDREHPLGNQPYAGTEFTTSGHYGSTVFDPFVYGNDNRHLVINICDPCLVQAAIKGEVLRRDLHRQPVQFVTERWDGKPE